MIYYYRFRFIGEDSKVKYAKRAIKADSSEGAKFKINVRHPSAYRFRQYQ